MSLAHRKRTFAAKIETTPYTYIALAAADAGQRVEDLSIDVISSVVKRSKNNGGRGTARSDPAASYMNLKFWTNLHGDGSTGDPSWAAKFLGACGMLGSSSSYVTSDDEADWKTFSAAVNRDGRRHFGRGFRGNLKLDIAAGMPIRANFDYIGGYHEISSVNPDDSTQLTGISFEEVTAPIFAGASAFTLASSTAYKISKATVDLGNKVFARHNPNQLGGYDGGHFADVAPTVTLDPEATLIATKDWAAAYRAGTQMDVVFVAGSTTGNIVTITCTNLQLEATPLQIERNEMTIDDLKFQVNGTITIAFT